MNYKFEIQQICTTSRISLKKLRRYRTSSWFMLIMRIIGFNVVQCVDNKFHSNNSPIKEDIFLTNGNEVDTDIFLILFLTWSKVKLAQIKNNTERWIVFRRNCQVYKFKQNCTMDFCGPWLRLLIVSKNTLLIIIYTLHVIIQKERKT